MRVRTVLSVAALGAAGAAAFAPMARGGEQSGPSGAARQPTARSPAEVAREIDALLGAAWEEQGLEPAPCSTDAEFVRRTYLDVVGTIPTAEQAEAFAADARSDKRERLVDRLLATPGHARHLANRWAEVLVGAGGGEKDLEFVPALFVPWLEKQFAARRPWGEIVRELLTATGTVYSSPPLNFSGRRQHKPADLAGAASQAFLGVRVQCAQCHDHPYEPITQKDFQGMAAFFARMALRPVEIPYEMLGPRALERMREREEKQVRELVAKGVPEAEARARVERMRPKIMEVGDVAEGARFPRRLAERRAAEIGPEIASATPRFLHGAESRDAPDRTRRAAFADWIADPANPCTARALANRYWGWFLGRGFVHPVDDFNSTNPPSIPAALDLLAGDTAQHGFDLDRLARIVTSTRAYELSSAAPGRTPKAEKYFAVGPLRPLTAQQTFDSLQVALGVVADGTAMSGAEGGAVSALEMEGGRPGGLMAGMAGGAGGTGDRSKLLLAQAARSFFLAFDDDEGLASEAFEGTIPQGLLLLNGQVVNGLLTNPRAPALPEILRAHPEPRGRLRHLFLRTLSREPTAAETARFLEFVKDGAAGARGGGAGRRTKRGPPESGDSAAWADALWALVASSEFSTNH